MRQILYTNQWFYDTVRILTDAKNEYKRIQWSGKVQRVPKMNSTGIRCYITNEMNFGEKKNSLTEQRHKYTSE